VTDQQLGRLFVVAANAVAFAVRYPHVRRNARVPVADGRQGTQEKLLLTLAFVGMMGVPLVYCLYPPAFGVAEYGPLPGQVWAGAAVFAAALVLFWRSHADLGTNWSPTLEVRRGHALVTAGVYRRVRHPMYAAIWLWGLAQAVLLPNWLAGPSTLWAFLPMYLLRVPREERMMLDTFGDEYRAYAARTGRVVPKFGRGAA
jgi:protein-S-isoprenylcysteine O-methyltransferase Ste14